MPKPDGHQIRRIFGARVRELRAKKGYSQEELAFRAGVHRTYLGGIERGERNPSLENISAIAQALGVEIAILFNSEKISASKHPNGE